MIRALLLLTVFSVTIATTPLRAAPEVVVAIRYLQAKGTSHSHLYLYRNDGKLLRQLTNDNSGQDRTPIFSPDGTSIVFQRLKPNDVKEYWSIEPLGAHLQKLDAAPEWYAQTKTSPFYTNLQIEEPAAANAAPAPEAPPHFQAPDKSVEIILREDPKDEADEVNGPGHGKHYLLHDLKTGKQTEFGEIPEFYGAMDLLHEKDSPHGRFLFDGALRVVFFGLHLDSTDGDTCLALDLTNPRFTRLSPNFALPIPLPHEEAFLTHTENRYVPIPDTTKTANCSYLERWDAKFKKVRYAREGSAAICYGASMYRPGLEPAVVTLRGREEE